MPKDTGNSIASLVSGWLMMLEVEALNLKAECVAARACEVSFYTINMLTKAEAKLAAIRELRKRLPVAWYKATVTEKQP